MTKILIVILSRLEAGAQSGNRAAGRLVISVDHIVNGLKTEVDRLHQLFRNIFKILD